MNVMKQGTVAILLILLGAGALLRFARGMVLCTDRALIGNVGAVALGGDPSGNGQCLRDFTCGGTYGCIVDDTVTGHCSQCSGSTYSKCDGSNNPNDFCSDNWGING